MKRRAKPIRETRARPKRESTDAPKPELRTSPIALLLIDVINPMRFPGAEDLLQPAVRAARKIARLGERARAARVPVIYVNDNFDCWHLGFRELIDELMTSAVPGLPVIRLLEPEAASDYYVLKPHHSGFFRTGLEALLERLGTRTVVLTGFATDICVLFTANDAYMRGFEVVVASDCVAAESAADHAHALGHMQRLLKARVMASRRLVFEGL